MLPRCNAELQQTFVRARIYPGLDHLKRYRERVGSVLYGDQEARFIQYKLCTHFVKAIYDTDYK